MSAVPLNAGQITPVGCSALAGKLSMDVPLQSLVLDFNAIGDLGVQVIVQRFVPGSFKLVPRSFRCVL